MNLCIIAKTEDKSARYLYAECKKKNFDKVFLADLSKLNVRISNKAIGIRYKRGFDWDVYVMRTGAGDFPFNYLVAKVLEKKTVVLPSSKAILSCSDRGLLAKELFEAKTIQPLTYISFSVEAAKKAAVKFKKFAVKFVKHGGKGVAIIERPSTASELLDIFSHLAQPFCIQRFIEGQVIKALVVGEDVIGLREYPQPGEERSNEGKREYIKLNEEVKSDLIKLTRHLKAYLFEVDLIERNRKYFVIDVSLNPDLKMYAELSGRNVGSIFADYILRNYSTIQPSLSL
jgi:glutathione synthase/RimK-type ligase-like ATP-grasp enzyme